MSYEEAIIAKQTFIQDVRDKVSTMKEEVSVFWWELCGRMGGRERELDRERFNDWHNEEELCCRRGQC